MKIPRQCARLDAALGGASRTQEVETRKSLYYYPDVYWPLIYPGNSHGNWRTSMNSGIQHPLPRLRGRPLHRLRRSPHGRARGQGNARPAQGRRRSRLRQRQRSDRHRFPAVRPSTTCWRDCPTPTLPSPRKRPPPMRFRAVPADRNSAWSRARSPCCPRHWEWLAQQSGGASVALRRLVDEARRANKDKDRIRLAREAAYRFIAAMGEKQTALRGSGARAVRGRCRALSGLDGGLARRRARPCPPACGDGVRTTGRARERCRLIARM